MVLNASTHANRPFAKLPIVKVPICRSSPMATELPTHPPLIDDRIAGHRPCPSKAQ
jgi:hypothetical protein